MPATGPVLPETLPPLRDDLRLFEAAPHADGSPSWTIQDPVNNAFYRIGWLEFEMLSRWSMGNSQQVLEAVRMATPLDPQADELATLIAFLHDNLLLTLRGPRFTAYLVERYRRSRLTKANWLLHHYLFFRIPLWHPDQWLRRTLPFVDWMFTRTMAAVVLGLCLLGLLLSARQIDVFFASFVETLSPGGLGGYLLALAVTKSLHELGHAFTATRYGVRVAHMGVAFLVLWPVLYTDTGESWRLPDRRQRLAIASAGIITELALAGLATLAWALASPGDLRQALFFLASTAWLISLGLNISPFMRFDGYFILSDLLDLPNLHERAFALARTELRNRLLGWRDPMPEHFSPRRHLLLVAFALFTWMYRLVMFIGIAYAVYLYFFKLLGIFLFAVEILWFVVRPIHQEFKVWHLRRDEISLSRRRAGALLLASLMLTGLIPWNLTVKADAWTHGDAIHVIYSPLPARIAAVPAKPGPVQENALLVVLEQPEYRVREQVAAAGRDALDRQLAGLGALPDGEDKRPVLEQQKAMKLAEGQAEAAESDRLQLRAPYRGMLTDVDAEVRPGVWVSPQHPLGIVVGDGPWVVEALVSQDDLARIRRGDVARFYPADEPLSPLMGRVTEIDPQRLSQLPHPMLSTRFGGPLPVLPDAAGLTPRDGIYRVRIRLDHPPRQLAVRRGIALVEAAPKSWLFDVMRQLLAVLIREVSF